MSGPPVGADVRGPVDARLADLLEDERRRWSDVDPDLSEPFEVLAAYVMGGGKRLRPAFCHWAFVGAGGDAADPLVSAAGAALEMLHTAALVHDDVIDASEVRHGSESVHVRFAGRHRQAGWAGRPERFGEGVAILIGDLALVYSSRLMAGAPPAAMEVFEDMRLEVNIGQYLDVVGTAAGPAAAGAKGAAADRARRICRYKTGKYTIERPLHLGAALARRSPDLASPLSDFGLPLGEAFQLKDDLLGVFGDPVVTGKPVGDDLREGKPTLLAGLAAERDGRFAARFGRPELTGADVADLQQMIVATGARADVEGEIAALVERSEKALDALPVTEEARDALRRLARFVAGRDR